MSGDLNVALVLKLIDQITAPAGKVIEKVKQIGDVSDKVGRAGVAWSNEQIAANRARQDALKSEAMGVLALGGSLLALTEPAIQAERHLAEVSKVVEFDSSDGLNVLANDIRELVTSGALATTARGVTEIVAAGARMGVVNENLPDDEKRRQLLEFAVAASKMSVAFGVSAEEAGTTLARWRQNLGLTQAEAMALGDTVNFLGNTMATTEADILQVINRQGVVAMTAGLAENQIAALSATLLAAGASPEIAATGLKNFTNALVKGESLTDRQSAVFKALGIDGIELAKRMQTDAAGGILTVLDAFEKIEPYRRSSLVGDLFGEEAKGAIMPLIQNSDMLRDSFAKTADTAALLGLMEKEYQNQAGTTFAQRQRLIEYMKALAVVTGNAVLPALNDLMATVMPIISTFTQWAAEHPELIALVAKLAAGLLALRVASIVARFGFFALYGPVLKMIRFFSYMLILLPKVGGLLLWLTRGPVKLLVAAIGLITKAFGRLALAVLTNPIGLAIAAVAALAYVVYDNWENISAWFWGKMDRIKAAFEDGFIKGILTALKEFNPITIVAEAIAGMAGYLFDTGVNLMQSLWDGMTSVLGNMVDAIKSKLSSIVPDWLIQAWNWVQGETPAVASPAPGRDRGGPVRANVPHWVGERGREMFIPDVAGTIIPTRSLTGLSNAEITGRIDTRPMLGSAPSAPRMVRQGDTVHIHIAPPAGTDERAIAMMVKRVLDQREHDRRADLHDGGIM